MLDTMRLEDIGDGRVANLIADFIQFTLDPVISPGWIRTGELQRQVDDRLSDFRSPQFSPFDQSGPISGPPVVDANVESCPD